MKAIQIEAFGNPAVMGDKQNREAAEVESRRNYMRYKSAWVWINGASAMSSPVVRSSNVLKRNSVRFADTTPADRKRRRGMTAEFSPAKSI